MKEKFKISLRNLILFLPVIIGTASIIWISKNLENKDAAIVSNFIIVIITVLLSHQAWIKVMELCGKKSFLIPLLIGTSLVIWINHNAFEIQNTLLTLCFIFFTITSSKHWWNMARDTKYRKKDQEYLATKPWYKRPNQQGLLGLSFQDSILSIPIILIFIIYMIFNGLWGIALWFCIPLIIFSITAYNINDKKPISENHERKN